MVIKGPDVRPCQHCHGQGQVYREVKPGKWEWQTCPACHGTGKVIMPNL
jgi:DnaJ-class molecular chaperone